MGWFRGSCVWIPKRMKRQGPHVIPENLDQAGDLSLLPRKPEELRVHSPCPAARRTPSGLYLGN